MIEYKDEYPKTKLKVSVRMEVRIVEYNNNSKQ